MMITKKHVQIISYSGIVFSVDGITQNTYKELDETEYHDSGFNGLRGNEEKEEFKMMWNSLYCSQGKELIHELQSGPIKVSATACVYAPYLDSLSAKKYVLENKVPRYVNPDTKSRFVGTLLTGALNFELGGIR
ncbi:hypothetical protein [Fodinibius salsisoli]|uniref:Uncharacterized protein n=1 Tax=Fodinibius salsisoli TaxID=2820877 RepID=A0ABT3PPQ6_9BACT|nr:hypothetical protein [Fodinibius salsisoli]MCW9707820.1 hypothetical protein [Fodinibius salsisoli]